MRATPFLTIALLALSARPGPGADEMPVPADLQVPLLLKILTYDRNFETKAKTDLTIGIVYDPGNPGSLKASNEVAEMLGRVAGTCCSSSGDWPTSRRWSGATASASST
ncbi:MAG: hypothetical protein DMD43_09835 [Gemmatimonadetes bacterium]|nr:MAG: hypothetical protein DMD43_09835 [Gemmatimonadota bacterium]